MLPQCGNADCPRRKVFFPRPVRKSLGFTVEDRWFCGAGCAQNFLLHRIRSLLSALRPAVPRTHRVPLGMLLVNRGNIDRQNLQDALRMQKESTPKRLGELLLSLGLVDELQLAAALSQQWACPYFPLDRQPVEFLPFSLAPLEIFRASHAVPAHLSPDAAFLHVAFCDRIDHTTLFALECMLGCRTIPSVATSSAILFALDSRAAARPQQDPIFESVRDPRDISATLASYAAEVRATQLKLVCTPHHLWGRLSQQNVVRDVLFQVDPSSHPPIARFALPAKQEAVSTGSQAEGKSQPTQAPIS
jgi:hypothetical protein